MFIHLIKPIFAVPIVDAMEIHVLKRTENITKIIFMVHYIYKILNDNNRGSNHLKRSNYYCVSLPVF